MTQETLPSTDRVFNDPADYAKSLAKEIGCENELVARRTSWNLTFQGFLFASLGLLSREPGFKLYANFDEAVVVAGICVSLLTAIGIFSAYLRINKLKKEWHNHKVLFLPHYPQPFGDALEDWGGRLAPLLIPIATFAAWLFIR